MLPAKLPGPFRQLDGPRQQLPIEIMRDHPLAEFHQDALVKTGPSLRAHTAQHQLPARVQLRGHDRVGIADLLVRLQQRHHREQRRRHWGLAAGLIHRGQLCLKRLVEQLRANLAEKRVKFADAVQRLGYALLLGGELRSDRPSEWRSA